MSKAISRYDLPKCPFCNDFPIICRDEISGVMQTKLVCCIIDTGWYIKSEDVFELWKKAKK